jgi:hypothetical protein
MKNVARMALTPEMMVTNQKTQRQEAHWTKKAPGREASAYAWSNSEEMGKYQ